MCMTFTLLTVYKVLLHATAMLSCQPAHLALSSSKLSSPASVAVTRLLSGCMNSSTAHVLYQQPTDCCRVCVDLCSLLAPGEGMLIGNFARAAFLVHSECTESRYINSRPFRVNAGPVSPSPAPPCIPPLHILLADSSPCHMSFLWGPPEITWGRGVS